MGYYLPETAPSKSDLTAKNRVWGFFAESDLASLESRPVARQLHRENYDVPRKSVSGIPFWPSRDPIGERGGVNLYGFVGNDGVSRLDVLGLVKIEKEYSRAKSTHETAFHRLSVNVDTSACLGPIDSLPCDYDDGSCTGDIRISAQMETTRPSIIRNGLTMAINHSGFVIGGEFHPAAGPDNGKPGGVYTTEMVEVGEMPCSSEGLCWEIAYTYRNHQNGEVLIGLNTSYLIRICVTPSDVCGQVDAEVSMVFVNGLMEQDDKWLIPVDGPEDPDRPKHRE